MSIASALRRRSRTSGSRGIVPALYRNWPSQKFTPLLPHCRLLRTNPRSPKPSILQLACTALPRSVYRTVATMAGADEKTAKILSWLHSENLRDANPYLPATCGWVTHAEISVPKRPGPASILKACAKGGPARPRSEAARPACDLKSLHRPARDLKSLHRPA